MNRATTLQSFAAELIGTRPFRIGGATVDPVSRDATWAGGKLRLQPQTLKVLAVLARHRDDVVSRDELVQLCWDGRIVGEDVINRAISLVRQLAEQAGGFTIETISRTGYRLVEVRTARRTRLRWVATAASAIAAGGLAALVLLQHRPATAQPPTLTVTVLPFTVDQADASERELASSARESVVRMLTDSGVSVKIGDKAQPASDLAISGEIGRSSQALGGTVRVEDLHRHAIIMSHQLDSEPGRAADLPDQMGANVAGALSWTGRLLLRDERYPSDPAFVTQLLDQDSNEEGDLWRAFELERRHAPDAPDSEIAQYGLAYDTGMLVRVLPDQERIADIAAGRNAARRARQLDPQFGDAYIPWCLLHPLVRLRDCEDQLRTALAVDPEAAFVPHFLARLMDNVGRTDEALALAASAYSEDQYAPSKIAHLVELFEAVHDSKAADRLYRTGARLWPNFHFIFRLRSEGIAESGDFNALYRFEQQNSATLPPFYDSALSLAKAVTDHSLPGVIAACPKTSIDLKIAECMLGLAQLGDLDDAFAYADLVYPQRRGRTRADEQRLWLRDSFNLDTALLTGRGAAPMRRDPRFLELAARLGLIDYWRSGRLPDFCTRAHEPICARISQQIAGLR